MQSYLNDQHHQSYRDVQFYRLAINVIQQSKTNMKNG